LASTCRSRVQSLKDGLVFDGAARVTLGEEPQVTAEPDIRRRAGLVLGT
jgi:hypothetical protein